jgi:hypothetical protein
MGTIGTEAWRAIDIKKYLAYVRVHKLEDGPSTHTSQMTWDKFKEHSVQHVDQYSKHKSIILVDSRML